MVRLAIDMMGSDEGPMPLAKGLKAFLKENDDVEVVAFGAGKDLHPLLDGVRGASVVETSQVVPMEISPLGFLRLKDSSMYQAIKASAGVGFSGVVTAGSTGGFVTGATLLIKNAPGVLRAGLAAPFVTAIRGKKTVILDIGASNQNTAEELVGFAKMGSLYAKNVLGVQTPRVYILSNGVEEGKGLAESVKAYRILKESSFPGFAGNCEARDALDGNKDVIVTPGYPGNILLKSIEGTAGMLGVLLKKAFTKNLFTKMGYLLAKPGLKGMKQTLDYRSTGGAILLGVNKVAVKAHGNSNDYAFYNALKVAYSMAVSSIVGKITEGMAK